MRRDRGIAVIIVLTILHVMVILLAVRVHRGVLLLAMLPLRYSAAMLLTAAVCFGRLYGRRILWIKEQ